MTTAPVLLNMRQVADASGLTYESVRTYRRDGRIPEPTAVVCMKGGHRPMWDADLIALWAKKLPGRGAPGVPRDYDHARPCGPQSVRRVRRRTVESAEPSSGFLAEFEAWKAARR